MSANTTISKLPQDLACSGPTTPKSIDPRELRSNRPPLWYAVAFGSGIHDHRYPFNAQGRGHTRLAVFREEGMLPH